MLTSNKLLIYIYDEGVFSVVRHNATNPNDCEISQPRIIHQMLFRVIDLTKILRILGDLKTVGLKS